MRQECIHFQHKVHILEAVNTDHFLIQILMYICKKLYMQRGESDPEKASQTTIKNTDQDYQKFGLATNKKTGPGPAFAGPVCIKLNNFYNNTNKQVQTTTQT